jgi:hypothetical protein
MSLASLGDHDDAQSVSAIADVLRSLLPVEYPAVNRRRGTTFPITEGAQAGRCVTWITFDVSEESAAMRGRAGGRH